MVPHGTIAKRKTKSDAEPHMARLDETRGFPNQNQVVASSFKASLRVYKARHLWKCSYGLSHKVTIKIMCNQRGQSQQISKSSRGNLDVSCRGISLLYKLVWSLFLFFNIVISLFDTLFGSSINEL